MRLNLVNIPSLIGTGLSAVGCEQFNPKFGTFVALDDKLFKYVLLGPPKEVFLIERISLSELFDGIPQSIEGIVQRTWASYDIEELNALLKTDLVIQDPIISEWDMTTSSITGKLFNTWIEFIGLGGLPLADVELSTTDGYLHVNAKRSTIFSGTVSIKVKVTE